LSVDKASLAVDRESKCQAKGSDNGESFHFFKEGWGGGEQQRWELAYAEKACFEGENTEKCAPKEYKMNEQSE
jgi:hypothetical protein